MRKWLRLFGFLVGLALIGFGLDNDFWRVKRVECQANGGSCSPDWWSELMAETSGRHILFYSPAKLSAKLYLKHPEINQLTIKKKWPSTLSFKIEIRQGSLLIQKGNRYFLVDEEGMVLGQEEKKGDWVVIEVDPQTSLLIGQKITETTVLNSILLVNQSRFRLLPPEKASFISPKDLEVEYQNGLLVLFSTAKEVKNQLDSLQLILERTKIEGGRLERVDLRFDKPVVVEKEKS